MFLKESNHLFTVVDSCPLHFTGRERDGRGCFGESWLKDLGQSQTFRVLT